MLLTVSDTPNEVEKMRKMFAHLRYFTYCALTEDMLASVSRYPLHAICLKTECITEKLRSDVKEIRHRYPDITILLVSDTQDHALPVDMHLNADTPPYHIFFHVLYYLPPSRNSASNMKENLVVKGLLFNSYRNHVRLYGWVASFTGEEVFLLRYLAEIYPRRASVEELASLCFGFGKTAKVSSVFSRISRINKVARMTVKSLSRPIVTYQASLGGYQIDF